MRRWSAVALAVAACGGGVAPIHKSGARLPTAASIEPVSAPDVPSAAPRTCFDAPPPGADTPPELPTYEGTCPVLSQGVNALVSSGADREFLLAMPRDTKPDEHLPIVFLWHWLHGDMHSFYSRADVQEAVDALRFIAVLPNAKGDLKSQWPVLVTEAASRIDEEVRFFDDMYACIGRQLNVNTSCASSIGVSAGALWTPVLASQRGDYLSSIVSLSGGSGGLIRTWGGAAKKMPAMVLWGGTEDRCFGLMDFARASRELGRALTTDGHFVVECIHNCGHAPPPFAVPDGRTDFEPMWGFVFSHPYWLEVGDSPYAEGVPAELPPWCAAGMGTVTPRTGACVDKPAC